MRWSTRILKLRCRRKMQLEVLENRQLLATITVNTTADDTTADATLSLREAIEVSDGTLAVASLSTQEQSQVSGAIGATNTIGFNIPTSDPGYDPTTSVWTIALQSALPTISTNAAIINGYTQPGAAENTLAQGDNAKLEIAISGTTVGTVDGLTIGQQGSQVLGLDIENFVEAGVLITAGGQVQVAGCFIGTDPTGETAAPNGTGVELENSFNTVGGPNVGDRNVLSGSGNASTSSFVHDGVYVPDQASNPLSITPTGNVIENNFIGLDATGTKGIENEYSGVDDSGSGDTYGGTAAGLGNVISGNGNAGLESSGSVTIEGNDIGTDATGMAAIGNGLAGEGIVNEEAASATSISTTISNNLVSGNDTGILLAQTVGSQSTYTIANNLIGTNATGTAALGSGEIGINLYSVENATVQNNVIAANQIGVRTQTSTPSGELQHDVFLGNLIGTDKTGQRALGNSLDGIEIESGTGITIGGTGPGQGNVIANSGYYGIDLLAGEQVQFTRNSIYGNAKGEIYQGWATNGFVSPPAMTFAPGTGGSGTLSGTLNGQKNTSYVVEIFSNPMAQNSDSQTFVQDVTVTTDGAGKGTFSLSEPSGFYTATTTDPSGDTSQFSSVAGTSALPATVTTVSSSTNPSMAGQQLTFTAVVTAQGFAGTPTGTVTFTIDGQVQSPVSLSVSGGNDEAQFVTSTLTAGAHSVTAAYSGDANVSPSSGSLPTQTVNAPNLPTTTTSLASSVNPSRVGQQVTFTAVVTAQGFQGMPTGTVTFTFDGQAQTPVPLSIVGGMDEAQFTTSTLTAGPHSVTAAYDGDSNVTPSTGLLPSQIVNAPSQQPTTTTLESSLNSSAVGQQVTFTAVVAVPRLQGTPTGTVTFTIDGTPQPPVPLRVVNGTEQAAFSIATLLAGTHHIAATYDGDTTFAASAVASPLAQTVTTVSTEGDLSPTDPPTVVSVHRFGIHMQPTVLVLGFGAELDPAFAQDTRNYKIVGPTGRSIGIRTAVYDPTAKTVTLRPRTRINLHENYHLTVIGTGAGGVTDSARDLAGRGGQRPARQQLHGNHQLERRGLDPRGS